jgi:Holliday junction resolvase RusA-like endonuclease
VPTWTKAQLDEYDRKRAGQNSGSRLRTTQPELAQGVSLVRPVQRKAKGGDSPPQVNIRRIRVNFTVYSVRPLDWDNYRLKDLQDCLVLAGFLDGDDWKILDGKVTSEKAYSKAEEKTVVEITNLPPHPSLT